jgi:hypothetical protein
VALVAIRAVPDIALHARVLGIGLGLGVATGADEDRVIRRIRMAVAAQLGGVMWNLEPSVIERSSQPSRSGVTGLTRGWESCRLMARVRGRGVILCVARVAIRRGPDELPADVATGARHGDVRARQREWRLRMIEDRASPRDRGVADGAVGGETRLDVIGIRGALIVLYVAGITISGGANEFVVDVAERAGDVHMRAGERKRRLGVVKHCAGPRGCRMTDGTVCWEARSDVIGIRSALIVLRMAGIAIGGRTGKLAVDVTEIAREGDMRTRQRELREFIVIEGSSRPGRRCMTNRAVGGETRLDVIRIRGALKILDVATVAIRRRAGKFAVDVAQVARDADVRAGEWERSLRMVKDRASPRRRRVTEGAIGGKSSLDVIGIRGPVVILDVATVAIGGRAGKLAVDVA